MPDLQEGCLGVGLLPGPTGHSTCPERQTAGAGRSGRQAASYPARREPETRDRLTKAGCEVPQPRSPAEVLAMWKADDARYGRLVKEAGIKAE